MAYAFPLWYAVFVFSLVCHEAAHAWAARRGGDPTAYLGGQLSLDPLPHIRREPVGMALAPAATFLLYRGAWMMGWASVPCDAAWRRRFPRPAAAMSAAGPLANLALALLSFLLLKTLLAGGWAVWLPDAAEAWRIGRGSLSLASAHAGVASPFFFDADSLLLRVAAAGLLLGLHLNLVLAVLNLMPLPPFDGLALLGLVLSHEGRTRLDRLAGEYGFLGWILACWATGHALERVWPPVARALAA